MNKTNYFNNGQEFNAYYPSGIVPSNELGVVGSYNSIYSFIKDVFGIEGGDPLQAYIDITSNSNVDVSTYAYAYVNVPIPSGYIQPSGTKSITSNGTSDVTTYASVNVNVPIPSGYIVPTGTKSITTNGTGIDVTAYASVDVAVPASGITPSGTYNITANGTFDVTTYASAYVSVSGSGPSFNWVAATDKSSLYDDPTGLYYDGIIVNNVHIYNPFEEGDYESDYSDYSDLKSWAIKTTQNNVKLGLIFDSDGDGDIDDDDEIMDPSEFINIDRWSGIFNNVLTPNHIYYITLTANKLGSTGFVFYTSESNNPVDGYVAYLG